MYRTGPDVGNDPAFVEGLSRTAEGPAPMTPEELASAVSVAVRDAILYVEDELGPQRVVATNYYHGKPFGNEEEGRSRAVMTEVRDGILGVLPALLRVLHGPEHTVEYVPTNGANVAMAEQATDYIRHCFEEDNKGFTITHEVLKDGLTKKVGALTWGLDETPDTKVEMFVGLTREELELIAMTEGKDILGAKPNDDGTYDAEVQTAIPKGRLWVRSIAPDDFFWNREARSLEDATLVGYRMRLTRGELRTLGVSEEDLDSYGGPRPVDTDEEQARRSSTITSGTQHDPVTDPALQRVSYCVTYQMLDVYGNGVPTLQKICTLGESYNPVSRHPASDKPFAMFSPDPEPHAMVGGSWFDLLGDAQLINSQLMRGMLDSLSISLFPRTAYVDGMVSVADILNTAIGAPIRMRQPGMVQPFTQPFTGEKVLPVMGMMRDVVERRIGQKDGAGSLDLDALQSTGAAAADAAIQAAQSQAELLARLYAEQVMKPMFRGLLRLVAHPASRERIIKLRGSYAQVSPASWDPAMDVAVTVALGTMDPAKKIAALDAVIADQTSILSQFGIENPVVTIQMLRNAKAKRLSLTGIKDVDSYYKPIPDDWTPPPPPPPEPTDEDKWRAAEAERAHLKAMTELAIRQDELALERERLAIETELERRKLALAEVDSVRKNEVGPHNADIERYKADQSAANEAADIESRERIEAARREFEREKLMLELEMERYKTDKAAEVQRESAKTQAATADRQEQSKAREASQPKEKTEPVVINVMPAAAPNVTVEAPVVNVPKAGKRKGKMTGPDGKTYTMESED